MTDQAAKAPVAPTAAAKGLQNIVVGQTKLSEVNGAEGKLIYAGYDIHELAESATFEEVIYLLWNLRLPTKTELEAFSTSLYHYMGLAQNTIEFMKHFPHDATPMAVLRTVISGLGLWDHKADDNSVEQNRRKAFVITAQAPSIVAAWERIRHGQEPLAPRADLGFSANFMYMLKGQFASPKEVAVIDAYMVLLSEHGMNASTFSARVTTSTLSDMYSAITTAVGTLKGASHGGANEEAMKMFLEIGSVDNVDKWFDENIKTGKKRVMGMGHRVYKALDPRAAVLIKKAQAAAADTGNVQWFDLAVKLDKRARADEDFIKKNLYANVDYYSAVALYSIGFPMDLFTPLFGVARMPGWTAHVMEQWTDNRLIRPDVDYVGARDLHWTALDDRT
jgi:citrate synthase